MTDEDAMLVAVLANPEDEVARLVYADAVQERDEQRAAMIRSRVPCVRCDARGRYHEPVDHSCEACEGVGWLRICEHEGCKSAGRPCYFFVYEPGEGYSGDPIGNYYCAEHAPEHGVCPGCFYTNPDSGVYCDDCYRRNREDEEDDFYDEDELYDEGSEIEF